MSSSSRAASGRCSPPPHRSKHGCASRFTANCSTFWNAMTTPFDPILQQRFFEHVASLQTPWGRWSQHARLRWQRLAWRRSLGGAAFAKRALDVMASFCALSLLSPLFLLIMIAVRCEDGRPVIFAQTRVGRFGRLFKMYKFRSMHFDAEKRLEELLATNHHNNGVK